MSTESMQTDSNHRSIRPVRALFCLWSMPAPTNYTSYVNIIFCRIDYASCPQRNRQDLYPTYLGFVHRIQEFSVPEWT